MHPQRKFSVSILLWILVGLFTDKPALTATHIISPEDNSVYIDQRDPDTNFVSFTGILAASELNENARAVIHFDLAGWAPDSIFQAKLYLYHYRGGNYTGSRAINAYSLTSAFYESTATWNSPWTTPGGDYDNSVTASADVPQALENWVNWDVTGILKNRWNNVANCGFLLKDAVEDAPPPDGPYVRFHSHRKDSLPYLEILTAPTGVEYTGDESTGKVFSLGQNFPNPFNSKTLFRFELSTSARVNLVIYNIRGEKVKTLLDARKPAGTYMVEWDATNQSGMLVSSGIYLYQLRTKNFCETKRLLYLK
jgi:hypothetical protein